MSIVGPKLRRVLTWKLLPGAGLAGSKKSRSTCGEEAPPWHLPRVPIRVALAVTFGVIIAVTAAALIPRPESGRQNTIELVRDRSERIIDTIVERTRLHLDPARDQSEFLARLFRDGNLDPQDEAPR